MIYIVLFRKNSIRNVYKNKLIRVYTINIVLFRKNSIWNVYKNKLRLAFLKFEIQSNAFRFEYITVIIIIITIIKEWFAYIFIKGRLKNTMKMFDDNTINTSHLTPTWFIILTCVCLFIDDSLLTTSHVILFAMLRREM